MSIYHVTEERKMRDKRGTYCSSKSFFAVLAKELLKYQWFDHRVNFDKSMLQTLYDESHTFPNYPGDITYV